MVMDSYTRATLQEQIFRSLIIEDATDYKPKAEATEYLKTCPWFSYTRVSFLNAWRRCTELLEDLLFSVASPAARSSYELDQLAYEVRNLEWLLDILIHKRVAEEFLELWAEDDGLSNAYRKASATSYGHMIHVSRVTAMLFTGIGGEKICANRKTMRSLLRNWLEYQQCGLMEDVLSNHVILNLTTPI